jgi:hypothetical protein
MKRAGTRTYMSVSVVFRRGTLFSSVERYASRFYPLILRRVIPFFALARSAIPYGATETRRARAGFARTAPLASFRRSVDRRGLASHVDALHACSGHDAATPRELSAHVVSSRPDS